MTQRDRRRLPLTLSLLFTLLPFAASAAPAAKPKAPAQGGSFFRLDKVKSTFSHSCGYRVKGGEKGGTQRVVVLSSVPLDCVAAGEQFDPVSFLEGAIGEKKGAYATLTIASDGSRIDGNWRSTEPSDAFSFGGQGEVQLAKNDDTRVEGRYRTVKPESFFDKFYEFDLTFAVDLSAGSLSGTPLPKGGGEPGKVYQAYVKAVANDDPRALLKLVVQPRAETIAAEIEGWDFQEVFKLSKGFELQSAVVTGGLLKGDRATLDVEGKDFEGDKMRGQVFLVKEEGAWKVADKKLRMAFD